MKVLSKLKSIKPDSYNPRYVRFLAAVIAAHLIISFDEPETFFELLRLKEYRIALAINSIMAFAIIELINKVTCYLDGRLSWIFAPVKRFCSQFIGGICIPLILLFIMAVGYFEAYDINILDTVYFDQYYLIIIQLVVFLNAYYVIHFAYKVMASVLKIYEDDKNAKRIDLPPALHLKWPTYDIALIQITSDSCFVFTFKNEKLVWPDSMETTIDNLPYKDYCIINRWSIVSFDNILTVKEISSRRYMLQLKAPLGMEVNVSQRCRQRFEKWMEYNGRVREGLIQQAKYP